MFGIDDSVLFNQYMKGRYKAIYPYLLTIVDCYFLMDAFRFVANTSGSVELARISAKGEEVENITVTNAYDIYDVDRFGNEFEFILSHSKSGASCYWDAHERFVAIAGPQEFISIARPFPDDIEQHRYIEAMGHLEESEFGMNIKPEYVYDYIKTI